MQLFYAYYMGSEPTHQTYRVSVDEPRHKPFTRTSLHDLSHRIVNVPFMFGGNILQRAVGEGSFFNPGNYAAWFYCDNRRQPGVQFERSAGLDDRAMI